MGEKASGRRTRTGLRGGEDEKKRRGNLFVIKILEVYKKAFAAAVRIFELSKHFPKVETFSLTDRIRRSSRSDCQMCF